MCWMSHFLVNSLKISDTNCGPLSLTMEFGMPIMQNKFCNTCTTLFDVDESTNSCTVINLLK